MHLKIERSGKSKTYSFKRKKSVSIGRSPSCDIQVVEEGISRQHLVIQEKNGEYFATDQGSTNGTYVDDQKMDAEKSYPFNSFFPLRLGGSVYVYLLDETQVKGSWEIQ